MFYDGFAKYCIIEGIINLNDDLFILCLYMFYIYICFGFRNICFLGLPFSFIVSYLFDISYLVFDISYLVFDISYFKLVFRNVFNYACLSPWPLFIFTFVPVC